MAEEYLILYIEELRNPEFVRGQDREGCAKTAALDLTPQIVGSAVRILQINKKASVKNAVCHEVADPSTPV